MKIYTRSGDDGSTGLFGGGRVPKDDRRVVAYGGVDELNAAVGAVLATPPTDFERTLLIGVQRDLFSIGARLASPTVDKVPPKVALDDGRVGELEHAIDRAAERLAPLDKFVLPGGTSKAAALHVARTACRRAERGVVTLHRVEPLPDVILRYLNRLSDLLFILARLANRQADVREETW